MVIDDELPLLKAYRRTIGRRHEVVVASSGARALEILEDDQRFDLLLCDLMMPDMDGIAVYEAVVRSSPALAERMVFSTGGTFTSRASEFLERVGNPCIDKPVDLRRLDALITARVG